jgi:hypothetical protein
MLRKQCRGALAVCLMALVAAAPRATQCTLATAAAAAGNAQEDALARWLTGLGAEV